MSDLQAVAVGRSTDSIRLLAQTARDALGYRDLARVQAEHLLEKALPALLDTFIYDIRPVAKMDGAEGYALPDRDYIAIREDVYFQARQGNGRSLFTVAHEVGHLMLHQRENLVLQRSDKTAAIFRQPEWQADTFAAEFLMDLRKIGPTDTPETIKRRFGVSVTAAERRFRFIQKTGLIHELNEPTRGCPAGS